MSPATGFVILHEVTKSRSKSTSKRRHVVGAAQVRVDELGSVCTVTYLKVSGPAHLVGKQGAFARADVYITPEEKKAFHDLVVQYWGGQWRGENRR